MKLIFLALILTWSTEIFPQHFQPDTTKSSWRLIDENYKLWKSKKEFLQLECDTFRYATGINLQIIDTAIKIISNRRHFKRSLIFDEPENRSLKITSVDLNKNEQTHLINSLQEMRFLSWSMNLFPDSKVHSSDSVESFVSRKENNRTLKEDSRCFTIFSFSNPILFRNDSVCLYIFENLNLSFRNLTCYFYEWRNDKWIRSCKVFETFKNL